MFPVIWMCLKWKHSHKWPLRKEHDYNPLGFAPYFQTNPSNFQLNHNLKSMSSHIFITNAHNYSVFYKYSQTLIFLININVDFSISSYQARVTFVQTVADLVGRQVTGCGKKTCFSIPYAPWCWNMNPNILPHKSPSFVGKYTIITWSIWVFGGFLSHGGSPSHHGFQC